MELTTQKRLPGELEFGIIYGAIAMAAVGSARFLPLSQFMPACVFHRVSGIACPTCGSTRSLVLLSHGDVLGSLAMNPLVSAGFLMFVCYFLYTLVAVPFQIPRIRLICSPAAKSLFRYALITLALANWVYVIATQ